MIEKLKGNVFIRNSIILFSGTMLMNILNYLFHLVVGRMVAAEIYGEIESLISLLTIVSVPAAAIGLIATKHGAKMKLSGDMGGSHATFLYLNRKIFAFGIPLLLLVFILTPVIQGFLRMASPLPLFFLWMLMFLSFLSSVSSGILSGWQKFGAVNASGVWSALVKLVVGVCLIRFGFLVSGAVGSFLLAGLVGYGISLLYLRRILSTKETFGRDFSSDVLDTVEIKRSVMPTFIGILAVTLLGNIDMIFAKHALDPIVSGEYGALSIVAKTIFFVTGVIAAVLFAMTSGEDQASDVSRKTFRQALALTLLIGFGSVVFFALFPKFALGIFFGSKYLSVSPLLAWFALAATLYSLANLMIQYLLSIHAPEAMRWFLGIAAIEILALYCFGNSLYGIIGLTIAAQCVTVAAGFFFVHRAFKR